MVQSVTVDEAIAHIVANRPHMEPITKPLADCLGHVLAKPVIARVSLPPANVSAMDGYAVRLADTGDAGTVLAYIGEASAGAPFIGRVEAGQAVRIFTGGIVPDGADHILIQEQADRTGHHVIVRVGQSEQRHIRYAGNDFAHGQTLVETGIRLGPAELGLAAAGNHARLTVFRKPRIALLANGDELKPPGSELTHAQIISSTPTAIAALIRSWGAEICQLGIAGDTIESLQSLITQGHDADLMIPIGGASVGDKDLMKPAFRALGLEPIFEKISAKPGKPTWFGKFGQQRVLGLPGNPAAAYIGAALYLPSMLGLSDALKTIEAETSTDLASNGPREKFLQARLDAQTGRLSVTALPRQSSAAVSGLVQANCLIRRPAEAPPVAPGQLVSVVMFKPMAL